MLIRETEHLTRSLLITLAILRTLAVECRHDISLLSPSLVSCLRITLDSVSSDLDVCTRAASVVRTILEIDYRNVETLSVHRMVHLH